MAWEHFRDPSYFDLWRVREVGERRFARGFHLVNGDEAQALTEMLNAQGMSAFGQDPAEGLEAKPASPTGEAGGAQDKSTSPFKSEGN